MKQALLPDPRTGQSHASDWPLTSPAHGVAEFENVAIYMRTPSVHRLYLKLTMIEHVSHK